MKKLILKLGTGILTSGEAKIHLNRLKSLAEGIVRLQENQVEVVIVSSGAVGLGMGKLGLTRRPEELPLLRACASIGQCLLMTAWSEALGKVGLIPSQVLLTRDDFNQRSRSTKVRETLDALLEKKIIPVVNENDSVSDDEIKFGDNDVLSVTGLLMRGGNVGNPINCNWFDDPSRGRRTDSLCCRDHSSH